MALRGGLQADLRAREEIAVHVPLSAAIASYANVITNLQHAVKVQALADQAEQPFGGSGVVNPPPPPPRNLAALHTGLG